MKTRTLAACLAAVLSCLALLGAAPLLPSTDFFINDQAGIVFREHREAILTLATTLEERTGIELVVLTVSDAGDMTPGEYADAVFSGWGIGGVEQEGVLIFVCTSPSEILVTVGDGLRGGLNEGHLMELLEETVTASLADNVSLAVMQSFRAIAASVYEYAGQEPDDELFREVEIDSFSILSPTTLLLFVVVVFAASRSMRVTRKYNNKYGNRYKYKRKDFSPKLIDEEKPRSRFTTREDEIARLKREALEELADLEREKAAGIAGSDDGEDA